MVTYQCRSDLMPPPSGTQKMDVGSSFETIQPLTKLQWHNQKTTILIFPSVEIKKHKHVHILGYRIIYSYTGCIKSYLNTGNSEQRDIFEQRMLKKSVRRIFCLYAIQTFIAIQSVASGDAETSSETSVTTHNTNKLLPPWKPQMSYVACRCHIGYIGLYIYNLHTSI
jgi:hypothetical protein